MRLHWTRVLRATLRLGDTRVKSHRWRSRVIQAHVPKHVTLRFFTQTSRPAQSVERRAICLAVPLLLTGRPGVGKTTALRAAAGKLGDFRLAGFYTEEIRAGRERRGFRLVSFTGETAIIAHVDLPAPRVSKYGVDVATIDRFAAALARSGARSGVHLIDEIGKMECLSAAFVEALQRLMESGQPLVATVAQRGGGFIQEVKRRHDVEIWTVTQATRDALPDRIVAWIQRRMR
jgi:nucleoside-triphosphatase